MTGEETATPRVPRTFGLKDVFTCINLLGGLGAIILCVEGRVDLAPYSFLLGYVLGDAVDGLVARLTRTGNRFGAEFDNISDHLAQCIAPAIIVYSQYRPLSLWLAVALAAMLVIAGSVRHARAATVSFSFPGAFLGMPRTISSFLVISFTSSRLIFHVPGGRWLGVALVVLVAVANLLPLPFRTHKSGQKRFEKWEAAGFFSTTALALIFLTPYTFDVVFMWILIYSMFSWGALEPYELRAFFARAAWWRRQLRQAR